MADYSERSRISYNKKAEGYDSSREGQFTRRVHQLLLPMLNLQTGQSILDVACGTGSLLAVMNAHTQVKGHGIDISERMIEKAAAMNPGMEFHVSGCEAIPFPNVSMDIITVCAAYHHFSNVEAFAAEAARVLKPNGFIYIVDMYLPAIIRVLVNPFVPKLFRDGDIRFYSPREIISLFARYGFVEVSIKTIGTLQFVVLRKE